MRTMRRHFLLAVILVATAGASTMLAPADMDLRLVRPALMGDRVPLPCAGDYRPCVCGNYPDLGGVYVVCDAVTVDELAAVLGRTAERDIFWLQVMPRPSPSSSDGHVVPVPRDVLGAKRVRAIDFCCSSPLYQLEIDPGAFHSSLDSLEYFYILGCDLGRQAQFEFLAGFNRLAHLYLYASANIGALAALPVLPALGELTVQRCSGWPPLDAAADPFPARSVPALRRLDLTDNALDDDQVGRVLETLDQASACLQVLSLAYNQLTFVPPALASFAQLSDLSLSGNKIPTVRAGRLKLSAPKIDRLLLTNTSLSRVEPQALQGNIVHADLSRNNLTRLDRDVFEPLLRQIQSNNGSFVIDSNPLNCCSVDWLVGSELMQFVVGGTCADGTRIDQLTPDAFKECPASYRWASGAGRESKD